MTRVAKITREAGEVVKVEQMRFLTLPEAKRLNGCNFNSPPIYDQLPWCPDDFKPLYRRLRQKGLSAKEARPLVEETIAQRRDAA